MAKNDKAIVKEEPAGALVDVSAYGEYADAGFEGITRDDLKTPFLKLLQTGSKEIAEGTTEGKAGQFLNTASGEVLPMTGFPCLLIGKQHQFIEWKPRDMGGGFIAAHAPTAPFVARTFAFNDGRKFGKLKTEGGNELIESHDAFIVILSEDGLLPSGDAAVFPFTSTKIDAIKNWYTKIMTTKIPGVTVDPKTGKPRRPPLFSFRSRIVGFKDPKTAKGIFYNVRVEPFIEGSWLKSIINPAEERDLLDTAAGYYDAFHGGKMKADYASQTADVAGAGDTAVPF